MVIHMSSDELVDALRSMEIRFSKKIDDHSAASEAGIRILNVELRGVREFQVRTSARLDGFEKTLNRIGENVDETRERVAKVEGRIDQSVMDEHENSEKLSEMGIKIAGIGLRGQSSRGFIDSPNLKWVVIPIILLLIGLFGLAGYDVSKSTGQIISGGE